VPFVLHSQPTAVFEPSGESVDYMATQTQRRYAEIMRDVEDIINDHSEPSPPKDTRVFFSHTSYFSNWRCQQCTDDRQLRISWLEHTIDPN
jgi:hypothetical protein